MFALLQELVESDGDVLVMHDGEKPYVVTASGKVQPSRSVAAADTFREVVEQFLPEHLRHVFSEVGGVEYELPPLDKFPHEHFTVVAARVDDVVHAEIRRRILADDLVPDELFEPSWEGAAGDVVASDAPAQIGSAVPTHSASVQRSSDDDLTLPTLTELWPEDATLSHGVTSSHAEDGIEGMPDWPAANVHAAAPTAPVDETASTADHVLPAALNVRTEAGAAAAAAAVAQAAREMVAEAVPAAVAAAISNAVPAAVLEAAHRAVENVAVAAVAQAARDAVAEVVPPAVATLAADAVSRAVADASRHAAGEVTAAVVQAARATVTSATTAAVAAAVADTVPGAVADAARHAAGEVTAAVVQAARETVAEAVPAAVAAAITDAVPEAVVEAARHAVGDVAAAAVAQAARDAAAEAVPAAVAAAAAGAVSRAVADASRHAAGEVTAAVVQAARETVAEAVPAAVAAAVTDAVPQAVVEAARIAVENVAAAAVAQAVRETVADATNAAVTAAVADTVPGAVAGAARTAVENVAAAAVEQAARSTAAELAPAVVSAAVFGAVADAVPVAVAAAVRTAVADAAAAVSHAAREAVAQIAPGAVVEAARAAVSTAAAAAVTDAAREIIAEVASAAVAAAVPVAVTNAARSATAAAVVPAVEKAARERVAEAVPPVVAEVARKAVSEAAAVAVASAAGETVARLAPAAVVDAARIAVSEGVAAAVAKAARETVAEAAPAAMAAAVSAAVADAVPGAVADAARVAVADVAAAVVAKAVAAALSAAATATEARITSGSVFGAPLLSGERSSQPGAEVMPPGEAARPPSAAVLEFPPSRLSPPRGLPPERALDAAPPRTVDMRLDLERLLRAAASRRTTTLYLFSNAQPSILVDGQLQSMDGEPAFSASDVFSLLLTMQEANREALRMGVPTEWTRDVEGIGQVNCRTFSDHRGPGGVFRMPIPVLTADQLGLTQDIQSLAQYPNGLVLVAGSRFSGRQMLMSALVDLINRTRQGYIVTLEEEVTVVHRSGRSVISQRQVRPSEDDLLAAAHSALRENPNVLLLDEIRTGASMNVALEAASSGRLIIAGLRANSAREAIDRIVGFYAPEHSGQVRLALVENLRGIVAQILLTDRRGGRVAAREAVNTPGIAAFVAGETSEQSSGATEGGRRDRMVQLTDVLADYVERGVVDVDEVYRHVRDRSAFATLLKARGIDSGRKLPGSLG